VGTPFTITIDYQSLSDGDVTVRDRDSALQERVAIDGLIAYIEQKLKA